MDYTQYLSFGTMLGAVILFGYLAVIYFAHESGWAAGERRGFQRGLNYVKASNKICRFKAGVEAAAAQANLSDKIERPPAAKDELTPEEKKAKLMRDIEERDRKWKERTNKSVRTAGIPVDEAISNITNTQAPSYIPDPPKDFDDSTPYLKPLGKAPSQAALEEMDDLPEPPPAPAAPEPVCGLVVRGKTRHKVGKKLEGGVVVKSRKVRNKSLYETLVKLPECPPELLENLH